MDSFHKWPPGTAGKLVNSQFEGYMNAMLRMLGGDVNEPDEAKAKEQETENFLAIATGSKAR